jgi:hypothetical protein
MSFFCYLLDDDSVPKKIKDLARISKMLLIVTPEPEDITEELREFAQEVNECYVASWDNLVETVETECPRLWNKFIKRVPPEIQDGIALEGKP